MNVFVTGSTGFIGACIVRELLKDGHQVRVLVRHGSNISNLDRLDVDILSGGLHDKSLLVKGMSDCDWVFHVAADYRLWTPEPQAMYHANVEGTRSILQSALESGVKRVVYTSSVGTLGNPGDGTPGNEDTPVCFEDMVGDYKKSKFLAEREAEKFIDKGLDLIIVNPSTPVGPNDIKPTPTGRIVLDFLNRKMPAYLDTGLNLIAVEDCARGHILAAEKGRTGEKYILGNRDLTLREIFLMLEQLTGIAAPKVRLPYKPILLAAYLNEFLSRITGREPLIPLAGVQMARKLMFFEASKAVCELGLPQTPVEEALGRAADWFRSNGYLSA